MKERKFTTEEYLLEVERVLHEKGWKFYDFGGEEELIGEEEALKNSPVSELQKNHLYGVLPQVADPSLAPLEYIRALARLFTKESGLRPVPRVTIPSGFKRFEVGETTQRGLLKIGDVVPFQQMKIADKWVYLLAPQIYETTIVPPEVFRKSLDSLNDLSHLTA